MKNKINLRKELQFHIHNLHTLKFLNLTRPAERESATAKNRTESTKIAENMARLCLNEIGGLSGIW